MTKQVSSEPQPARKSLNARKNSSTLPQSSGSVSEGKKGFAWALIGQFIRIFLQGISFFALARSFHPTDYGAFSAVTGFAGILIPFSGIGAQVLLLKYASIEQSQLASRTAQAHLLVTVTGPLLATVAIFSEPNLVASGLSIQAVACIVLSDVILQRFPDIAFHAFQSANRLDLSVIASIGLSAPRVLALLINFAFPERVRSIDSYSLLYLSICGLTALISFAGLKKVIPEGQLFRLPARTLFRNGAEGGTYAMMLATKSIYSDIDKAMLARLDSDYSAGIYTAGYRTLTLISVPIQALLLSRATTLFKASRYGAIPVFAIAKRLYPILMGYATAAALIIYAGSSFIEVFLGKSYHESVVVARCLAGMPLIQATHSLFGEVLIATNRPITRAISQFSTAVLNVVLNLALIGRMSWHGAILATYASEAFLTLCYLTILIHHRRQEKDRIA